VFKCWNHQAVINTLTSNGKCIDLSPSCTDKRKRNAWVNLGQWPELRSGRQLFSHDSAWLDWWLMATLWDHYWSPGQNLAQLTSVINIARFSARCFLSQIHYSVLDFWRHFWWVLYLPYILFISWSIREKQENLQLGFQSRGRDLIPAYPEQKASVIICHTAIVRFRRHLLERKRCSWGNFRPCFDNVRYLAVPSPPLILKSIPSIWSNALSRDVHYICQLSKIVQKWRSRFLFYTFLVQILVSATVFLTVSFRGLSQFL
jgi:hypothetical protein